MEQFEGFEKLKKMKNENGMEWEKWVNQTNGNLWLRLWVEGLPWKRDSRNHTKNVMI